MCSGPEEEAWRAQASCLAVATGAQHRAEPETAAAGEAALWAVVRAAAVGGCWPLAGERASCA
jgi:hypothetical protein